MIGKKSDFEVPTWDWGHWGGEQAGHQFQPAFLVLEERQPGIRLGIPPHRCESQDGKLCEWGDARDRILGTLVMGVAWNSGLETESFVDGGKRQPRPLFA